MRIALLSRNAALYSTSRIVLSGRARGHEVEVIDPLDLELPVAPKTPAVTYRGQRLPRYDVVVPRIGTSITRYGLAVLRAFERQKAAIVLNDSASVAIARDKLRSLDVLRQHRLAVPRTVCLRGSLGAEQALALVGGCPAVVKLEGGTQGVGTMLAESPAALLALLETFAAMGQTTLLQEYVPEARDNDLRVFVVGDRVAAAMRRSPPDGDFRANLHRGAVGEGVELRRSVARIAVHAAAAVGLEVCGVDIIDRKPRPVVLELNSSPGLEGIEQATGVDVARHIIEHAEQRLSAAKRKPKKTP